MAKVIDISPDAMRELISTGRYRNASLYDFDRDRTIYRLNRPNLPTILKTERS